MNTPKKKKQKVWTYSPSHSFNAIDGDKVIPCSMMSQLYKIGVYVILNNDPGMQLSSDPAGMAKAEKAFKKQEIDGKIKDLVFSPAIRVTKDDDEFFIQL